MQTYHAPQTDLFFTHTLLVKLARVLLPITITVITVLALIPPEQVPLASLGDKVLHICAFFTLAALVDTAWPNTPWNRKKLVWLTLYGLALEIAQSFHPLRTFALDDLVADIIGQGVYVAMVPVLKYIPIVRLRWHKPKIKITAQ